MASSTASVLHRQLARVRRRLFLGSLLNLLAWCWVAALAVSVGWFLLQPFLLPEAAAWLRWAVLGGLAGAGTLAAVVLAVLRAPSPVAAALSLDERFGLKERVTTSLTLDPRDVTSPAGQALLADANTRVASLRVGDRFPVRLPWKPAALLPAGAAALALLFFFGNPQPGSQAQGSEEEPTPPVAKADIDKQMKQLALNRPKKPQDQATAEDLARIEAEIEKFARKSRDTKEEVRERIKDATGLEEQIKQQQKERADRVDALKEQMNQAERLAGKKEREAAAKRKNGPARNLSRALQEADFKKAQEEAERLKRKLEEQEKEKDEKERLKKKLKDEELNEPERKEAEARLKELEAKELSRKGLEQQLKDMQDELERLTRDKEEEKERLKDLADKGELDQEQLQRELDQLDKNAEKLDKKDLEELKELAEKLGECQQCLKEGKDGDAAKKMGEAGKKMGKLDKDGEQLARTLKQVQAVKRALCRAAGGQAGQASGRRPEAKEGETGHEETQVRGDLDKGRLEVTGTAPGGGFKGPRQRADLKAEIEQATQEAPAAIDRERLPPSAKKMARGYFERVRGPDKGKKKGE